MEFGVLGPLIVFGDDEWLSLDAPEQRMILGVLLARAGRVVGAEQLMDVVWSGEPPAGGLRTLRYHVSKLRDALAPNRGRNDPGAIRTVGSGYQLAADMESIDSVRFERRASDGAELRSNCDFDGALQVLDSALGLWRGDAWEDFRYEDFAQPLITKLEEMRLAALEDRIDARTRPRGAPRADRGVARVDVESSAPGAILAAVDARPLPRGSRGRGCNGVRHGVRDAR